MVDKQVLYTERAPKAVGCYSQAILTGNWLFLSGQIGLDPLTMRIVEGGAKGELEQIIRNMKAVLSSAGRDLSHIVKQTVFLTDMSHFPLVNEVMMSHFALPYPARSAVQVAGLPLGALIEIEAIAAI